MSYLSAADAGMLLEEARLAGENTHSPYSKFVVGAAVLAKDGHIYRGTNVENASFGLTICAERVALSTAVTAGTQDFTAIAVYGDVDAISPCGACRQFIIEFGPDIIVIFKQEQQVIQKYIHELLPFQFKMPG